MGFKFNPLTGQLDLVNDTEGGARRFEVLKVEEGESITLPETDQMSFAQDIIVDGNLMIEGVVTQLSDIKLESFYTTILQTEVVRVLSNRLLLYSESDNLIVDGVLMVDGSLRGVA